MLKAIICSIILNLGYAGSICHNKHDKVKTPLSQNELFDSLYISHVNLTGVKPSKNRLAMAWAHVAFENGRGQKMFNNNFGNIGVRVVNPSWPYYMISGHKFRSFQTPIFGAQSYWKTIFKCQSALNQFDAGNSILASRALRRCKYYEANEEHYENNLTSIFIEGVNAKYFYPKF